jgi:uncharacterized protein (TIGR02246 family)
MSGIVISGDSRGGVGGGGGGKPGAKADPAAFKAAIGGVLTKLQEAWNKGDAKAMAAQFGEQADYVTMGGGHISGRAKIEEAHKAIFANKTQCAYRVVKMKPLSPDVVLAFLGQQITSKGADDSGGKGAKPQVVRTRPVMVLRKVGNAWPIVAYQVTRASAAASGGGGKKAEAAKEPAKKADKK